MMNSVKEAATWYKAAPVKEFPRNGGLCVKIDDLQVAVFNFTSRNEWFACQNLCPHKLQMILSRGMIGDKNGIPKVACPFHKKTFSLETGENLDGEEYSLQTFPVKVEAGYVYVGI
ncbi:nitrite reductase (NAD(P)H) small subunit [Rhodohalobacter sp. SW132]|uniref:nitrite reductase small subunit NirD n=1 Tax=Rhodohalobacter sp. SW132 TaxID=2293433 RepID=UPI000E229C32|nr:nitrite reductase small subunit NirD [Rhodohalobacter sp. SW132]REL29233.1 nitrite reductase (NAD(P)H) small subunit [Rhodohalobacter sp. SW132]